MFFTLTSVAKHGGEKMRLQRRNSHHSAVGDATAVKETRYSSLDNVLSQMSRTTVPLPPPGDISGSNARDARTAARDAAREQANQQQGGHWN